MKGVLPILLLSLIALTGCETTSPQAERIAQHSQAYAQLSATDQAEVSKGSIKKGYTPQMVFLALGKPDDIDTAADGVNFVWVYRNFYPSEQIVSTPLEAIPENNPLEDVRQAWVRNQDRIRGQLTGPERARRRRGETWAEYDKRNPADSMLHNDLEDRAKNQEIAPESRYPDSVVSAMRLEVIFENAVVHDAIVNGVVSAFTPPKQ